MSEYLVQFAALCIVIVACILVLSIRGQRSLQAQLRSLQATVSKLQNEINMLAERHFLLALKLHGEAHGAESKPQPAKSENVVSLASPPLAPETKSQEQPKPGMQANRTGPRLH